MYISIYIYNSNGKNYTRITYHLSNLIQPNQQNKYQKLNKPIKNVLYKISYQIHITDKSGH